MNSFSQNKIVCLSLNTRNKMLSIFSSNKQVTKTTTGTPKKPEEHGLCSTISALPDDNWEVTMYAGVVSCQCLKCDPSGKFWKPHYDTDTDDDEYVSSGEDTQHYHKTSSSSSDEDEDMTMMSDDESSSSNNN